MSQNFSPEAVPGRAGVEYRIIKGGDPNFGLNTGETTKKVGGGVYSIDASMRPTYAMPTGPGGGGRRRKATRTFPRGILRKTHKILPSANPSKLPPTRKRSVRLMTNKGMDAARKTAKSRAAKTDIKTIRKILVEKKLIASDKKHVDPNMLRSLYANAVGAGLI
uniref:Uncharacterized protein n=1 Tax=viral metagenome TaxID=1070528 RepID=A0A6C0I5I4_9ZZZZ